VRPGRTAGTGEASLVKGRTGAEPGCRTPPSISDAGDRCAQHRERATTRRRATSVAPP